MRQDLDAAGGEPIVSSPHAPAPVREESPDDRSTFFHVHTGSGIFDYTNPFSLVIPSLSWKKRHGWSVCRTLLFITHTRIILRRFIEGTSNVDTDSLSSEDHHSVGGEVQSRQDLPPIPRGHYLNMHDIRTPDIADYVQCHRRVAPIEFHITCRDMEVYLLDESDSTNVISVTIAKADAVQTIVHDGLLDSINSSDF